MYGGHVRVRQLCTHQIEAAQQRVLQHLERLVDGAGLPLRLPLLTLSEGRDQAGGGRRAVRIIALAVTQYVLQNRSVVGDVTLGVTNTF